ncbi:CYTH and CHAD domain-containing protein [Variovorax saccharolyticus]|uniref:CYTH and CHAD domain-containing protein n=1 Tax=Variovorax saccharolyticus TaxID=3053516 RepID=UPI002575CAE6|nr:CYTH and CHAD domain-containing protein [Variovorax sp. J31P216]MDM0024827.1 CHAD domain-containing protein [Variovorax sp. J31P216]
MTEFELKFQVDAAHQTAVEAAVARGRSHRAHLRARYYDTADGALAAQRIVLRVRKEDGAWIQTAKAPGRSLVERLEHNAELPPAPASATPLPLLGRHEGTPVGERIAEALRQAGHDPAETIELVPLYGTDVWRTTREMRSGDALVELAFDVGSVRAGDKTQPLRELEIELKHGSPSSLLELAGRWSARYGLWLDTVSKSQRGERLARGATHGAPVKASPPRLKTGASGPELFRAVLDSCLAQILPNASEVAAGSPDPEHVHQLRVGIRRLRTALREMASFAPAIDPAWEPVLAETFGRLGRQRDRDHVVGGLQPRLLAHGAPPVDLGAGSAAIQPAEEVVRDRAFQSVLMRLIAASLPAPDGGAAESGSGPGSARKAVRDRLSRLHRQVLKDGQRFERLEPEQQHRVRKRLKRLRYLGEFVAPLFGRRAAERFLAQLEPAQDALGEHNDAAIAMAAFRAHAAHDGAAWFAVGWLAANQPASAKLCRQALVRLADLRPFWKD